MSLNSHNAIVWTGEVDPKTLLDHPSNYKVHTSEQRRAMEVILNDVGFVSDVLVNRRTGRILDGHLRAEIARDRNQLVPVRMVDISEEDEVKYLATIDPTARLAVVQRGRFNAICKASFNDQHTLSTLANTLPKVRVKKNDSHNTEADDDKKTVGEGVNDSLLSILDEIPTDDHIPQVVAEIDEDHSGTKFVPVVVGKAMMLVSDHEYREWEAKILSSGGDVRHSILELLGLGDL